MSHTSRKEVFGWAMFDFANQAYTLLIITVIFGDLFTRVIVGDAETGYRLGNLLWSLALATSYALVVLTAPVAGAVMDFSASRKRFLFASYVLTILTTAMLYFVAPGYIWIGMLLIILSNFAYSIGEAFVASFLPDLGPREKLGSISGFGWAMGYIGGLIATAFALVFLGEVSAENFATIRWVGPFAALFFLVAAIPTFLWLRERGRKRRLAKHTSYFYMGVRRVRQTFKEILRYRELFILLCSIFFAMAGIYIIIAFTFIYGAQVIAWDEEVRIYMFITVQLTAAAGALAFGLLQDRLGGRLTYNLSLFLWIISILLIYFTPKLALWLSNAWHIELAAQHLFLVVGSLAGLCLGSTQSAGRALVGMLAPKHKAAEFFGFWGLASKLAAIFGLLGIGLLQMRFGLHVSILFCAILFALALLVSLLMYAYKDTTSEKSFKTL